MRIVRLPWAIATVEMRTLSPITMVPDFSSMTTRAIWSGVICSCSMSVRKPTTSLRRFGGGMTSTVPGSRGRATGTPAKALIACAMRRAVVKSGLRSVMLAVSSEASSKETSRSTMAPLATRPPVGVPRVTEAPAPDAAKPEIATGPWPTA